MTYHWHVMFSGLKQPLRLHAKSWVELKSQLDELMLRYGWFLWLIEDGRSHE